MSINLNRIDEKNYVNYVKTLIYELFQIYPSETEKKNEKAIVLRLYGKAIVDFFISKGLSSGDKTINQANVPYWIKKKNNFMISGIKGLFDTDGSLWVNNRGKSIILSFRNASLPLAKDFKQMCEKLHISTQPKTSKYQKINKDTGKKYVAYQVLISKKSSVKKFLEIIDPEKWKDNNRHEYLGIKLMICNSTHEIQNKIRKQICIDYPRSFDRTYTLEFYRYLKKLCIDFGLKINKKKIEEALKNALKYQKSNRN